MANTVPINLELELSAVKAGVAKLESMLHKVREDFNDALTPKIVVGELLADAIKKPFELAFEGIKKGFEAVTDFMKESLTEAIAAIRVDTALEISIRNAGKAATFSAGEIEKLAHIWQDKTIFDH